MTKLIQVFFKKHLVGISGKYIKRLCKRFPSNLRKKAVVGVCVCVCVEGGGDRDGWGESLLVSMFDLIIHIFLEPSKRSDFLGKHYLR